MKLLLDGDVLTYRVGFSTESLPEYFVKSRIMRSIDKIVDRTSVDDYTVYLTSTDKSNFRHTLYPEYKANRKAEKPMWYDLIRQTIMEYLPSEVAYGCEADDLMGINQKSTTIIASIDKDMDMIPGFHYNFVKEEGYFVSEEEGLHNFYMQLLTGDTVDNVPGLPQVGPKTAAEILKNCNTDEEYYNTCLKAYKERKKDEREMLRNGRLLWIWRSPNDVWRRDYCIPE